MTFILPWERRSPLCLKSVNYKTSEFLRSRYSEQEGQSGSSQTEMVPLMTTRSKRETLAGEDPPHDDSSRLVSQFYRE